ncbi:hypothetical protein M3J09_004126 [Ascochyta lentis]
MTKVHATHPQTNEKLVLSFSMKQFESTDLELERTKLTSFGAVVERDYRPQSIELHAFGGEHLAHRKN